MTKEINGNEAAHAAENPPEAPQKNMFIIEYVKETDKFFVRMIGDLPIAGLFLQLDACKLQMLQNELNKSRGIPQPSPGVLGPTGLPFAPHMAGMRGRRAN